MKDCPGENIRNTGKVRKKGSNPELKMKIALTYGEKTRWAQRN